MLMVQRIEVSIQQVLETEVFQRLLLDAVPKASKPPPALLERSWSLKSLFRQGSNSTVTPSSCDADATDGAAVHSAQRANGSTARLRECLEPIIREMENLNAEEFLDLARVECGALLRDGIHVRPIHNDIVPQHTCDPRRSVRYVHVGEVPDQYSMGVFVFPPLAKIPLHDHPGMCVVSRLLYGSIQRLSLDLSPIASTTDSDTIVSDTNTSNARRRSNDQAGVVKKRRVGSLSSWLPWSSSWLSDSHTSNNAQSSSTSSNSTDVAPHRDDNTLSQTDSRQKLLAFYRPNASTLNECVDWLAAPECTVLFPTEGNVHEFTAGPQGAAILDVLLPPYDVEHDRDCTFYEVLNASDEMEDDTGSTSSPTAAHTTPKSCWLVPTQQPDGYHCISGQYKYLGRGRS